MADPQIGPVYLIVGSDDLKRKTARKRLIERISKMGDIDFNLDTFDGERANADDIVSACDTIPFASDVRLVIVDNVDRMSKDSLERVTAYCKEPSMTTVLCMTADKLAKNTALYKVVARSSDKAIIDCTPKMRRELPALVAKMARTHGVAIEPRAADLLIDLVGESTVRLDTELTKMASTLHGEGTIDSTLVANMVARSAELKPWALTDALSMRDLPRLLDVLSKLDSQSPYGILALSVSRIRELLIARTLDSRGRGADLSQVLHRPDWQVRNHIAWARRYSSEELIAALHDAARTERAMKSGSDADMELQLWLAGVCTGKAIR